MNEKNENGLWEGLAKTYNKKSWIQKKRFTLHRMTKLRKFDKAGKLIAEKNFA